MNKKFYIGLMSGTSMDAVDAALVSFQKKRAQLIETHSIPTPEKIKSSLQILLHNPHIPLSLLGETDTAMGKLFAEAALQLLSKTHISKNDIAAIGSHGQTLYHAPHGENPFTLQIGDPNIIAATSGITTVADFRRKDMALNGQGAPLAPAFHAYLFPRKKHNQWIVNIGGIANVTRIPANEQEEIIGFDIGPGNTLLDQWCEKHTGLPYDNRGEWAKQGRCDEKLLQQWLADAYFQKTHPKSTGREYFNLTWFSKNIDALKPVDVQSTLTELTAKSIAFSVTNTNNTGTIFICGGGAHNDYLIERLSALCHPLRVTTTAEMGIAPKWIEAMMFAWLAKQTLEKKPGNLPSVTGASQKAILGAVVY